MSNFYERLLTSVFFVIVLLGSLLLSEFASSILFFFIILLCQHEFYAFYKKTEIKPQRNIGMIGGVVFFLINALTRLLNDGYSSLFLIIPLVFLIFIFELYRNRPHPLQNIGATILGIIYIAVPIALLHELSYFDGESFSGEYSYHIVIGFFLVLWANDTGAYLIGRKFGKHKSFERISPKKTWEGTIGGAVLGIFTGYICSLLFSTLSLPIWLCVAALIVIFGSLGDLVESMFKRSLNIKDSGKILPGHGGVLDRFDGIFIAAPIIFTFLKSMQWW